MAKLVLSSGGTVLNQYFIDKPRMTIGRAPGSDIVIDTPRMSREHAAIVTIGHDQVVEDLGSSNGTFVNGARVTRHILQHRDVIEFGEYNLCYMNVRAAADSDFDRTMIIEPLPLHEAEGGRRDVHIRTARRPAVPWPKGLVKPLTGPHAGVNIGLHRVVTVFGEPGEQLAVITRRPIGFFLTHVEGSRFPRINRKTIGAEPQALRDGDLIEVGAEQLEFHLEQAA